MNGSASARGMEPWRVEAYRAIGLAIPPGSRKTYEKSVRLFEQFKKSGGYCLVWPIPVEHLLHYNVALREQRLGVKSIRGCFATLAFASKAMGYLVDTNDFRVRKMLEGWAREVGPKPDEHQPISPDILKGLCGIWPWVCFSGYKALLFHAVALVAFFVAVRISKIVCSSKADVSRRAVEFGDVRLEADRAQLTIWRSKTDQTQKGKVLILEQCSDKTLCLVAALSAYLAVRGAGIGPLFCHGGGL